MIPGLNGSLLSEEALERVVPDRLRGMLDEFGRRRAQRQLRAWHLPLRQRLGPACSPRTIFDRLAVPLFSQLGYHLVAMDVPRRAAMSAPEPVVARLDAGGATRAVLLVTGWGQDASSVWREAVRHGIALGRRWCFCLTGPAIRVFDAVRTYSRRFVEFDVAAVADNEKTFAVFWGLLRAAATTPDGPGLLDRAVSISEEHREAVRSSLQEGVQEAVHHVHRALMAAVVPRQLRAARGNSQVVFDEALQIVYRILFLLFAEARGLVPRWHPAYRDAYTIDALRVSLELVARPRGLWEALQSITRLAHRGCRIGALRVTAFNGHLFSPHESPLADALALDDGAVRQALLSLTTRESRAGRQRISYGDLGVEQLGGVYERLLDVEPASMVERQRAPAPSGRIRAKAAHSNQRKATGSFYTPRSLTEYLVRRTLAPLVQHAPPDRILALRILDPAMGSGAFLVAACRYLAAAYESALLRDGVVNGEEIDEHERAGYRRAIAQRCLYGVDFNPAAVQLARLSLWLATLSADRPLTFLDHRVRSGNSLVGATPADLCREPRRDRRDGPLPLFDDLEREAHIRGAIETRETIAREPGDTLAQVRSKEQALAELQSQPGALARWKSACDLWCVSWFPDAPRRPPAFSALIDAVFERGALPRHTIAPVLGELRQAARQTRPFHWTLEFPEVFHLSSGAPADDTGFDAIVGNPPWEMLRGDRGDLAARALGRASAAVLTSFSRGAGFYRLQGDGHPNSYQLFVERMLTLLRRGGRLGVIVPWGLAVDQGAARLRRELLDRTSIDTLISIENRDCLFPIHRGLKFLLLCTTTGRSSPRSLPCRFGVRRIEELEQLPETGPDPRAVEIPRQLLDRIDAETLAIPDIRTQRDIEILRQIVFTVPALGDPDGWNVRFGRELNASDDRRHFEQRTAATSDCTGDPMLPVIEGKHLTPFAVAVGDAPLAIRASRASTLIDRERTFARARLAYRDVAAASNRLTLIAAIVPAGVVTTHTLFCLRQPLAHDDQLYLCAMLNSYVANYLVRMRVTTHVTCAVMARLPVPVPQPGVAFRHLVRCAASLHERPDDAAAYGALQAWAAAAYGLTHAQLGHVLSTFPLVPAEERHRAASCFCDIVR
jgi:hypothetical protein